MTPTQKVQLAQSKVRAEIGAILSTDEEKRESTWSTDLDTLTKRAQSLEVELRAALVAGDDDTTKTETETETETATTPEEREKRELVNSYRVRKLPGRGCSRSRRVRRGSRVQSGIRLGV